MPRVSPSIARTKIENVDKRVSVCTDCEKGIFTHHNYLWTGRGLVHQECEDSRLRETKTIT